MRVFSIVIWLCFLSRCRSEFWRRKWHSSAILRDWLYIDGGQIYDSTQKAWIAENSTIGIDLSKDWTNTSLALIYSERPSTLDSLNSEALWPDDERNMIYCFGGDDVEMDYKNPSNSIQGFKPDGNGGGQWTEIFGVVGKKPFPDYIQGVASGKFTGDTDEGFYLGGYMSNHTAPISKSSFNDGLLTLNFENLTFTNSSNLDLPDSLNHGAVDQGVLLNVPIYGSKGVLLDFGGGNDGFIKGFNSINIFDKAENKWHYQIADGDTPSPRAWFCAVGVHGMNHTSFEIIVYGGATIELDQGTLNQIDDKYAKEVYVLSLPAFRWFRANYTSPSLRIGPTCHATKTRQMIVVGGLNSWSPEPPAQDPWNKGIGVFDMTVLEFKDSYESTADSYEPPYAIQQYYKNSESIYPSSWTFPALKEIFEGKPSQDKPSQDQPSQDQTPQDKPRQSRSHLGRGALVGTIMGCIIATLVGAVSIICWIKKGRRKRTTSVETVESDATTLQNPPDDQNCHEMMTEREPRELMNGHNDRTELPDQPIRPPGELKATEFEN